MPIVVEAVTCHHCKKMHSAKGGRYILVACAEVREVGIPPGFDHDDPSPTQSVKVGDVVVCNNKCLSEMLSLKGF